MKGLSFKLTLALVVAVGISIVFIQRNAATLPTPTRSAQIQNDGYMKQFDYVHYSNAGNVSDHFTAPRLEHYTNNLTRFALPNIHYYSHTSSPWTITANQGQTLNTNTTVLSGHVLIQQNLDLKKANSAPVSIETTKLTIDLKHSIATTQQPVTITQNNVKFYGKGAIIDLKKGTFTLLSHTVGNVKPANNNADEHAKT